ncbi:MAG: asparaginase [Candidatus Caenarcaniphilales bacterium]|nr:asparaginase [Candidatus Caenarcaniphilales bacterium]
MQKFAVDWKSLKCGEHRPIDKDTHYGEEGTPLRKLQNNCSAKHCMMIAACKLKGWDLSSYLLPSHPLQKFIIENINSLCELSDQESISLAVDGCGLPTYTLLTQNILKGFSKLNLASGDETIVKLIQSLVNYPFYVSGYDRLDYELSIALGGQVVCKSGAGGLIVIAFQEPTYGALVLKMYDSDEKVKALVVKAILEKLGYKLNSSHNLFSSEILNLHNLPCAKVSTFC